MLLKYWLAYVYYLFRYSLEHKIFVFRINFWSILHFINDFLNLFFSNYHFNVKKYKNSLWNFFFLFNTIIFCCCSVYLSPLLPIWKLSIDVPFLFCRTIYFPTSFFFSFFSFASVIISVVSFFREQLQMI